nr:RNA cytidine acetyltransferase 1-like [Tanacetum cinerariifolium]
MEVAGGRLEVVEVAGRRLLVIFVDRDRRKNIVGLIAEVAGGRLLVVKVAGGRSVVMEVAGGSSARSLAGSSTPSNKAYLQYYISNLLQLFPSQTSGSKPHLILVDEDLNEAAKKFKDYLNDKSEGLLNLDFLQRYAIADEDVDIASAMQNVGKLPSGHGGRLEHNKAYSGLCFSAQVTREDLDGSFD